MHLPFSRDREPTMLTAFQAPTEAAEQSSRKELLPLYAGAIGLGACLMGVGIGVSTEGSGIGGVLIGIGAGLEWTAYEINKEMRSEEK